VKKGFSDIGVNLKRVAKGWLAECRNWSRARCSCRDWTPESPYTNGKLKRDCLAEETGGERVRGTGASPRLLVARSPGHSLEGKETLERGKNTGTGGEPIQRLTEVKAGVATFKIRPVPEIALKTPSDQDCANA